ncbi:9167_t:CDS:2, partial [Acaulospora morrowiae]
FKDLMKLRRTCKLWNELVLIIAKEEIFYKYRQGWEISTSYFFKFIQFTNCTLASYDDKQRQFCFLIDDDSRNFKSTERLF